MYTKEQYKDIEEIQELIKEKGLDQLRPFSPVMSISKKDYDDRKNYYKSLEGKYLKKIITDGVRYSYIHLGISSYLGLNGEENLRVIEDTISFTVSELHIAFSEVKDHMIFDTKVDRYKDYKEITEENFKADMERLETFKKVSKTIREELRGN